MFAAATQSPFCLRVSQTPEEKRDNGSVRGVSREPRNWGGRAPPAPSRWGGPGREQRLEGTGEVCAISGKDKEDSAGF